MDIEKRYAGRGTPINHWHYDHPTNMDRRLDVLEFASGEFAVWNPLIEECISFWPTEPQATLEAKRILGVKY